MDKVMLSLTNFAAEMERERARQRTHDALLRKAKALHVARGSVLAFALSFDEVIVTTFTAGQQSTLPIWMLNRACATPPAPGDQRSGRRRDPGDAGPDPPRLLPHAGGPLDHRDPASDRRGGPRHHHHHRVR
jgi:hypothetical protein